MPPIVIDDTNYDQFIDHTDPHTGKPMSKGLVPRDYSRYPVGYLACAKPFDVPVIPRSEWKDRLAAQKAAAAQMSAVRSRGMFGQPIPSRDQDGVGYCWCHSATSAVLVARALANEPYVDLSAFSVGCKIKGYRDQGGWGAEAVEYIAANGVASSASWPQKSMSRANDTDAERADAAKHKIIEWMDLEPGNWDQVVTCCLLDYPLVVDFSWWSHSVMGMDVGDDLDSLLIWNSWKDSWGTNGTGWLKGSKARPDGALAIRVSSPSVN